MGVFERLGEKVERFKQEATAARDESADYRCRACGTGFYSERESCPECGSAEIERVEETTADEEATTTDVSDGSEEETAEAATEARADGTEETTNGADETVDTLIDEAEEAGEAENADEPDSSD